MKILISIILILSLLTSNVLACDCKVCKEEQEQRKEQIKFLLDEYDSAFERIKVLIEELEKEG